MEYDRLGDSGLRVSRISLGCMSFGDPSRGFNEWSLGEEHTQRFDQDPVGQRFFGEGDRAIVDAVQKVAEARGIPMAQVALAWVLQNPVVTAPIVGATKSHHLADAAASIDIDLTDDEIRTLEEPYTPREPAGF